MLLGYQGQALQVMFPMGLGQTPGLMICVDPGQAPKVMPHVSWGRALQVMLLMCQGAGPKDDAPC